MALQCKEKSENIKLKQPNRLGQDPSRKTLIDIAEERRLFQQAAIQNGNTPANLDDEDSLVGRLGESIFWSLSLSMLHFTLDVLVSHQYAVDISWPVIAGRAAHAFPIIFLLIYSLHPHNSPPILLPRLPPRIQPTLHQILFFSGAIFAGCYLIHISNTYGYYAVMKQAPPIGCLWIWSVIELDVQWAASSLIFCAVFLKYGGYSFL
ncbi:hypothetical protein BJ878DRAFT_297639 [Calycina marina]|uniref:DUF7719 domain-containing protein n=1 Tax=Calycina marina TaxID=1763456 RepID=A0A9P7YVV0_9HELO|nr:hypothetical protein BJ878DRAFT_297639 [Calycina marina]